MVLEGARVLQSGNTECLFRRPDNETVARLLGAEIAANGIVTWGDSVAIGANVVLKVAGPALQPGARVGWSVS
jgi:hypothetical protein